MIVRCRIDSGRDQPVESKHDAYGPELQPFVVRGVPRGQLTAYIRSDKPPDRKQGKPSAELARVEPISTHKERWAPLEDAE
jgi:hypothetical protein